MDESDGEAAIRVVVADDEAMMRAGIRAILTSVPGFEVVGEAADGDETVSLVAELAPEVALVDVQMPGTGGLAATEAISAEHPDTAVVVLTTFSEDTYIARALSGGAAGFVLKSGDPRQLISGLRAVVAGGAYLSPEVARRVSNELDGGRLSRATAARERVAALSEREREVLALLGEGCSNDQVARRLHIAPGTAKVHVRSILTRLDLGNRVQAAVLAYEAGLTVGA
ncbi:response regulator [Nocardiopsis xinjiangensis]|uniref:response regulator n=1 Tax=Nocardiopsis xinjiangensis TaxID=124285 RepID=UPI00034D1EA9|nr:response regulator transcription factor [Nocardiopsis xinjiangensis]